LARPAASACALAADDAFALEAATAADFEPLLALRLRAMRESLERIGRYDERATRERFAAVFDPAHTRHIVVEGERVGFLVLKRLSHALRLEHLAIDPPAQRRGIGSAVLRRVCDEADRELLPVELVALKGSAANRFYLRHGFVEVGEGEWDIDYLREPTTPSLRAVRSLWRAVQARDWPAARALLDDRLHITWWTSGERFESADAFVEANVRYPEGWTIHLLELGHLQDGRVLSLVRVDHPPRRFFATSIFRVDDGRITGIDEYWAGVEPPPAWRDAIPGRVHFDPSADPRAHVA
jgi:ribosomal protein S18 acetylase RimI-like enzyme